MFAQASPKPRPTSAPCLARLRSFKSSPTLAHARPRSPNPRPFTCASHWQGRLAQKTGESLNKAGLSPNKAGLSPKRLPITCQKLCELAQS
uniref:Uncharacterized protein n=1 Tax=Caenorhabditis japonica TaxID=281687 RepID=A0A8R1DYC3_CAEJA